MNKNHINISLKFDFFFLRTVYTVRREKVDTLIVQICMNATETCNTAMEQQFWELLGFLKLDLLI